MIIVNYNGNDNDDEDDGFWAPRSRMKIFSPSHLGVFVVVSKRDSSAARSIYRSLSWPARLYFFYKSFFINARNKHRKQPTNTHTQLFSRIISTVNIRVVCSLVVANNIFNGLFCALC